MKYFFSDGFNNILENAEIEMKNLKHPYVGTEHLLLAFLKADDDDYIVNLLNDIGLNYYSFKQTLLKFFGVGNIHYDFILYTPLLRNIIDNSICYSDDNFINEKDLFFSFCFSEDGVAKSILKIMGIDIRKTLKL